MELKCGFDVLISIQTCPKLEYIFKYFLNYSHFLYIFTIIHVLRIISIYNIFHQVNSSLFFKCEPNSLNA